MQTRFSRDLFSEPSSVLPGGKITAAWSNISAAYPMD